jgi:hypothetical protein
MALDTLAKQFVPALNQNYRYWDHKRILEFDDGTEYALREAVIIAKGKPNDEDLKALHLIKRVFDGVVMTEQEIDDFILFKEVFCEKNNVGVALAVLCRGDRNLPREETPDGHGHRGGIKTAGGKNGPDSVQELLDLS